MEFQTFDATYLNKLRSSDETTERHFANYFGELISLKLRSRLQSPEAIEDVKQEKVYLERIIEEVQNSNA